MICLSIKEKGLNSVQDALSKVHLAEIRLDYTNLTREETVTLFRIKKDLIATCRLTELPVEECRKRLTWAIMASRTKKTVGKRYIDIEYDSPSDYRNDLITAAHKRGFNIILSYHNYKNTDSFERLCEIYEACKSSGADIIKIVTTAQSMHDCTRVLRLYKEYKGIPLIAFCMGETARFTRILSLYLGAPFTFVSLSHTKESAEGQFTIAEAGSLLNKKSYPNKVNGKILNELLVAPASKSHSQRAILAAALAKGKSALYGYTPCADSEAALEVIRNLGAKVKVEKCKFLRQKVEIVSPGIEELKKQLSKSDIFYRSTKSLELCVGESGLLARLLIPIVGHFLSSDSKGVQSVKITGKGTLNNRIMFYPATDPFSEIGLQIESTNDRLPATIKGHIKEGNLKLLGGGGSQLLSGLLMSLPMCEKNSTIEVKEPTSTPYVDLTIQTLKDFGVTVTNHNFHEFKIPGKQRYKARPFYPIEGDWSGASMLFVAGAITNGVTITNLPVNSKQADEKIISILRGCGVEINIVEYPKYLVMCGDVPCAFKEDSTKEVILGSKIDLLKPKGSLLPFEFDATNAPDLFPSLVVLALNCEGESRIKGIKRLSNKESNRAESLYTEFTKLGADIDLDGDWMIVKGAQLHGGFCSSHNDHRIAMAIITAGLKIKENVFLDDLNCISKSFPDFMSNFK